MTGHILTRPQGCKCHQSCEFPCWQRVGWATPCDVCGCHTDETARGHVRRDVDTERCPGCGADMTTGDRCPVCKWRPRRGA